MKIKLSSFLVNFFLVLLCFFLRVPMLFSCALLLWINAFLYSIDKLGKRSLLFVFLIAFFVFLMGREIVEQFFGYKVEQFEINVNTHAWKCLVLSLATLWFSYIVFEKRNDKVDQISRIKETNSYIHENLLIEKIAFYLFVVSWVFAVTSRIIVGKYVSSTSYWDYYTGYSEYLSGNIILYIISKLELVMPVALSLFMASIPSKKRFALPCIMYVFYLGLSILGGQRSTFMLGVMFLAFYFLFRQEINPEEGWFKRKHIFIGVLLLPVLAYLLTAWSYWRGGVEAEGITVFNGFENFLYDQGVSLNAVKNAYKFRAQIPRQVYSLEFLHSGIWARILGITVYHGNTIEHALYGGSLTHSLGYTVLGTTYLAGVGTGSSYIAEVFFDFGYIGVILGNIIYSIVLANANRIGRKNNTYTVALRFYVVNQILWAPRASFTGFIGTVFTPTTVAAFVAVFFLDKLFRRRQ